MSQLKDLICGEDPSGWETIIHHHHPNHHHHFPKTKPKPKPSPNPSHNIPYRTMLSQQVPCSIRGRGSSRSVRVSMGALTKGTSNANKRSTSMGPAGRGIGVRIRAQVGIDN